MNETIEVVAKDVAQAVELGLTRLRATIDQVEVQVLSHGGFFKSAKILIAKGKVTPLNEQKKDEKLSVQQKQSHNNNQQKPVAHNNDRQKNVSHNEKQNVAGVESLSRPHNKHEQRHENRLNNKHEQRQDNRQPHNKNESQNKPHQQNQPIKQTHQQNQQPQNQKQKPKATPEHAKKVSDYVKGLISKMGIEGEVEFKIAEDVEIEIKTQDASAIGYKGETLGALELLANAFSGDDASVVLDTLGYRQKRINILKSVADKTVEKALRIGKKVFLEPMDNRERKIIHTHLENHPKVISKSEGNDNNRRVVVIPKK
ncbi:MAG: hypothetical protein FWC11_02940 [Firmicutes bacterium]|nr:hypothetical protein [Bacillota bacterium]MCL2255796.1 hypothetical protein [Bacillota bacterium]